MPNVQKLSVEEELKLKQDELDRLREQRKLGSSAERENTIKRLEVEVLTLMKEAEKSVTYRASRFFTNLAHWVSGDRPSHQKEILENRKATRKHADGIKDKYGLNKR